MHFHKTYPSNCQAAARAAMAAVLLAACSLAAHAQGQKDPLGGLPDPPPSYHRPEPEETGDERKEKGSYVTDEEMLPVSDAPWGLSEELLSRLERSADLYRAYTRQFTCIETARSASYKKGEAEKEKNRSYSFLLATDPTGSSFTESRRVLTKQGGVKKGEAKDEEPFPPAYAWVFLFSSFNQPFFSYRDLGDRFDGFDWVREIQFRGALPFSDGKDIREWEGVVLVDAATHTPLEIRAKPKGQEERLRAKFSRYSQAFNLMGLRLAPRPFGYRCRVEFHFRKDDLTFPTRLRYDTFRAVKWRRTVPWKASSRTYSEYRFFQVGTRETIGETKE